MTPSDNEPGRRPGDAGGAPYALVRAWSDHDPSAPALLTDGRTWTYAELCAEAERIASALTAAGLRPGDVVGLYASRSAEAVLGIVGIVAAGGAYAPLDPTHAPAQLGFIARDLDLAFALVAPRFGEAAARDLPAGCHRIDIDAARRTAPCARRPADPGTEAPIYVMYTSGTTGTPKGVVVPRRALMTYARQPFMSFGPGDRILHHCTLAADGSVFDIWTALLAGAAVAVLEAEVPTADAVAATMRRHAVTAIGWYAGLHHVVVDHDVEAFSSVRFNLSGGDRMSAPHAARLLARFPAMALYNSYGPTETVVGALAQRVTPEMAAVGDIPIGTPYQGYEAFLVDRAGAPVADVPDAEGELVIAGEAVALGYHARPDRTAEVFVPDPRPGEVGTVYRTGDLARRRADGGYDLLGRTDRQVKVGGRRVELDGLEAVLGGCAGVRAAAAWVVHGAGGARIAAAIQPEPEETDGEGLVRHVRSEAAAHLGEAVVPGRLAVVAAMPLTPAGKVDRKALAAQMSAQPVSGAVETIGPTIAQTLAQVWDALLGCGEPPREATFFDLGGNSLLLIQAHGRLERALGLAFPITELFAAPRFAAQVARLADLVAASPGPRAGDAVACGDRNAEAQAPIAVIGMAARLPGIAETGRDALDAFWRLIAEGRSLVARFTPDDLEDAADAATRARPDYVAARPVIPDAALFDAAHFGIRPREAERMDPQARVVLELCRHALDDAGIARERGPTAVFAGATPSTYLLHNLMRDRGALAAYTSGYQLGDYPTMTGNSPDSLATRVAHLLGLTGPAMSLGTACSSSLTAVAQAVGCLRAGQAETALAGGVSITFPQRRGYLAQEGGMASLDGVCRPFDADANGTVFGDGAGVVVLKRLSDALRDGDPIRAVIRGVGLNNDGADKTAYTAPSVAGQAAAIRLALADADVPPGSVGYVEAHGTATPLGDPIEVAALARAFEGAETGRCLLGAVKGNLGHSDAAAGVLGLIKTVMVLERRAVPPVAGFAAPSPRIPLDGTPFRIADRLSEWPAGPEPRRAGVSSFGVGGTNAHVVLEEAPARAETQAIGPQILPLSARSADTLDEARSALAAFLETTSAPLAQVAATLQRGRPAEAYRLAVSAGTPDAAAARLREAPLPDRAAPDDAPPIVFLFPGQGGQYPGMGAGLYAAEPIYRDTIDEGAEILAPLIGEDIRRIMIRGDLPAAEAGRALRDTRLTQPALFVTEVATARLWAARGVTPDAMVGHSVGETVAATIAGVMSFADGLALIARRGALMQAEPEGAMLSVRARIEAVLAHLGAGVDLAATNAPRMQVLSGPTDTIAAVEARLTEAGIVTKRLHTSHAFHSTMMDPVVAALETEIADLTLHAPGTPIVSTVTGERMTDDEARDPAYWAGQARACVNFQGAVAAACEGASPVLVEAGPGATLSTFAAQALGRGGHGGIFQSLPDHTQAVSDVDVMASACASLWRAGVPLDWNRTGAPPETRRCSIPGTVFRRRRFWVDPPEARERPSAPALSATDLAPESASHPSPEPETAMTAPTDRITRLDAELRALFSDLSGEALGPDDTDTPFLELGFDSLFMGQISTALDREYGVTLSFRSLLSGTPTVNALARHLDSVLPPEPAASAPRGDEPPLAATAGQAMPATPRTDPAELSRQAGSGNDVAAIVRAQMATMQAVFSEQLRALGPGATGSEASASSEATVPAAPARGTPAEQPTEGAPATFHVGRGPALAQARLDDRQRDFAADLARRVSERFPTSKAYTAAHRPTLADPRTAAGFRPDWKELVFPVVAARAHGAEIDDIDGTTLVDLVNGFGQTAFGHSPAFVREAVARQMERGFPIGPQSDLAGPLADRLAAVTGHERVTFCNTGSEAVMAAMRLARAVTARERIVVFSGDYHGQFDEVLVKGRRTGAPAALPIAPGIPRSGLANMTVLPYGADGSLDWLRENAQELAAVIVEPVQSRHPDFRPEAFVREVREIVRGAGTAFVMDEVVTGFRVAPKGMQGVWGIDADMACYGKVVGGGMPVGVLAGAPRWMDALDGGAWSYGDDSVPEASPTFFAGTFVRHPLVLAAVDAVLDHLETAEGQRLYTETPALTADLAEGLRTDLGTRGLPASLVEHYSSWFVLNTSQADPRAAMLYPLMRLEGVHLIDGYAGYLTTAHTEAHAVHVRAAFARSLDALQSVGILEGEGPAVAGRRVAPPTAPAAQPPLAQGIPLTESQREIWMTHQLGDAPAAAFNETVAIMLDGELDRVALEGALADAIARHDALRIRFARSGETFDVGPPFRPELPASPLSDEAALDALLLDEARMPVRLTEGPPLRARLVQLDPARHALVLTVHHIACDGWSYGTLLSDLAALYSARLEGREAELAPAPSFAAHASAAPAADATALDWWRAQLADPPALPELPTDRPRPAQRSFAGASLSEEIPAEIVRAARKAGARQGCTLFATLFAATQIVIARLSGAADIVLGVPSAGQADLPDPGLVGHCVTLLPVRVPMEPEAPAAAHLRVVGAALAGALEHRSATLGQIVRAVDLPRGLSRQPLTEIQFNLERESEGLAFGESTARVRSGPKAAVNFDLFFNLVEHAGGVRAEVDYNADLYDAETVRRWVGHLRQALAALAEDADRPAAALPLMDVASERALVEEANAAELDVPRDGIAAELQARFPSRGARIAVALPRRALLPAALLGVLRAGHAYVPLDPGQPEARKRQVIAAARADALLAVPETAWRDPGVPVVDAHGIAPGGQPVPIGADPEQPAYVIFTSGSTGTPKGVAVPNRAMVNFLTSMLREPGLVAADRLLAVTTASFDIAVLELFGPLLAGGTVRLVDRDELFSGHAVVEEVNTGRATILQATPTLFGVLLEAGLAPPAGVRLLAGGEPVPPDLAERLMAGGADLWNMYGPTETTVWSAVKRLRPGGPVTIGGPIANTELHVLDGAARLLPPGAVGELWIGGDGLALGYFDRDDLTDAAFRQVTLAGRARRLYRTGDLARRQGDGEIVVLGRRDGQVKLRGFRIELGEIETHLRAAAGVRACAVDKRDVGGEGRLVAWIVGEDGAAPDTRVLEEHLAARLPDYMVPQVWAALDALPQTANGKLDRKALVPPEADDAPGRAPPDVTAPVRAPEGELEERLAAIWRDVLGLERIDPEETLFRLGADSLSIFRIAARQLANGLDLEARDVIANPSIRALAAHAEARAASTRSRRPSLAAYRDGARRAS